MLCEAGCPICERLRKDALKLVGEGGIEALTHDGLAERAGLLPREVREHYPSVAECLYATYEEVTCSYLLDLADAFSQALDWSDRLECGRRRLLDRISGDPGEARLVFIESMRDPVLRKRRALNRKWIIEYLASEWRKRYGDDGMTPMQFELMIGAGFQLIANALADGGDVYELEPRLAELGGCFIPAAV
jgi:AcrR family transcriptional regulator